MSTDKNRTTKNKIDASQWISQAEAAKLRGVTRQAIARLVAKGRFETLSIGGKKLLRRADVEKFKAKPPGPSPSPKG
jgi:excisionase family DNA binding protein